MLGVKSSVVTMTLCQNKTRGAAGAITLNRYNDT